MTAYDGFEMGIATVARIKFKGEVVAILAHVLSVFGDNSGLFMSKYDQ